MFPVLYMNKPNGKFQEIKTKHSTLQNIRGNLDAKKRY